MKFKTVLVFTLLVLASLISFSNRNKTNCDGRKMMVSAKQCMRNAEQLTTSYEAEIEAAGTSPLLRIAVTL
jgi:CHASE3 domain sensor protein